MDDRASVVVLGSLNVDLVTSVERLPKPGETVSALGVSRRPGGKGANQALGAVDPRTRVSLVGRVGEDADGAAYREALRSHGLDVDHILATDAPTGLALVMVERAGENSIVVVPGANHEVSGADVDRVTELLRGAAVLVAQLELPLDVVRRAFSVVRDADTRVLFNPSPMIDVPPEMIAASDPLVVNEHEAMALLERPGGAQDPDGLARDLLALGATSVALTLGGKGAVWADAHGSFFAPAAAVSVVDTTGAGDAFAGALAASLAVGEEPRVALDAAMAAGGRTVGHEGAQPWVL